MFSSSEFNGTIQADGQAFLSPATLSLDGSAKHQSFERANTGPIAGLLRDCLFGTFLVAMMCLAPAVHAEPFSAGPKVCQECHEAEYNVWKDSQHFATYKEVHKKAEGKAISKAAGGGKSVKKNETCQLCHYTMISKEAGGKTSAKAGPSCESCHGASSDWLAIHNDDSIALADRHQQAKAAGMIWSFMHYDIAANCMSCHGLANPALPGDTLAAMLEAGHPINPDFELVRYSQGTVRHRFYAPDTSTNSQMDAAELARLFVIGQAAKLVSAIQAAGNSKHPAFVAAQTERAAAAKAALNAVNSLPEVAALLAAPSAEAGRKLADAIKNQDLSGQVGSLLPAPASYK